MSIYDRLARKHCNTLTIISDHLCQGCHRKVSPQFARLAVEPNRMLQCEHCGRMVFTVRETKTRTADPATPMLRQTFTINNPNGLHARPCALLIKTLRPFRCEIRVECKGQSANADSILGLMSLAAACGSKLTFSIIGGEAAQAIIALHGLFDTNFGDAYRPQVDPAGTAPVWRKS
jgi:phosphotransferase system HPr (HPr) family protein